MRATARIYRAFGFRGISPFPRRAALRGRGCCRATAKGDGASAEEHAARLQYSRVYNCLKQRFKRTLQL